MRGGIAPVAERIAPRYTGVVGTFVTLCRYWVKSGRESAFRALLEKHWPTFQKLDLVSDVVPHLVFRGEDAERGVYFVETFPWKSEQAMSRAHSLPEVMAVWGPMGECCTSMEFPTVERIDQWNASISEARTSDRAAPPTSKIPK